VVVVVALVVAFVLLGLLASFVLRPDVQAPGLPKGGDKCLKQCGSPNGSQN
jgi:hypothetical protein